MSLSVLNKHYDLRTKEEAREARRTELKKHLEGYEDQSQTTVTDPTWVEQKAPLASDINAAKERIAACQDIPSRRRLAKGLVGYGTFVTLLGLDFTLLGFV